MILFFFNENLSNLFIVMIYLDYILEMAIISLSLGIILLASSSLGQKILNHGHKILTTVAATTTIINKGHKPKENSGGGMRKLPEK
jgi:hypothetical protein